MSYIYLQEQGEVSLAECYSDIPVSVLSNLKSTPERCYSNDSATESCHDSQSGTTSKPSTEGRGEAKSMSYAVDSPAKTYPAKGLTTDRRKGLMAIAAAFGRNIKDLLQKLNLDSSLPKTRQILELADLSESSKALPVWGIMQDGAVLEVITQVRIIEERESGYLPTVLATDWKGGTTAIRKDRGRQRLDQWRDYVKVKFGMTYPHPTHSELRMGWPEGWTDSKPLEMDRFLKWLHSHGIHSHKG